MERARIFDVFWIRLRGELLRVHEEAVAHFKALNPDMESPVPGLPAYWTYGTSLKYLVFHVAYHVGQIVYLARQFAGDKWQTLTVPKKKSAEFNRQVAAGEKSQR